MNSKERLTILLIDRKLKEGEDVVKDIFLPYKEAYGLIMFPPKEDDPECLIQVVFDDYKLVKQLERLLSVRIEYDPDDVGDFFDFDTTEITEDAFYDVLAQEFEVETFNLSEVEK